MDEQKDFFTKNHGRLLDIAVAAKNVAWVVLVVYILSAGLRIIQYQYDQSTGGLLALWMLLTNSPIEFLRFIINILATVLRGVVYYLVLKGIYLGLNMIIETDINYRKQEGDAQ